jgi:predicted Mrr-cat superfamily restriction endonuclease
MAFYLIRVGEGSKHIEEAHEKGFVAIGWNEVPDLSKFKTVEQIKKALHDATYGYTDTQIAINAGQIFRFGIEIRENSGDAIHNY